MNRNEMIKWLQENTTQEQWFDRTTLFFIGESKSEYWETCNSDFLPVVHVRGCYNNHDAEPIYYLDVFEQPVFIDGAEYVLHFNDEPPRNAWYKLSTNEFHENMNRYPASDFGKHFTVELVTPETPDYVLTGKGNINALSNHLKMNGSNSDDVAGAALSRLKEGERIHKAAEELIKSSYSHLLHDFNMYNFNQNFFKLTNVVGIDLESYKSTPDTLESSSGYTINELREDVGLDPVKFEDSCTTTANLRAQPRNKYDREILPGVHVDVYDVLGAFKTDSAAIDHAVKKLLAPGQRGVKDRITDLNEAINSIQREIERLGEWEFVSSKPIGSNGLRRKLAVRVSSGH